MNILTKNKKKLGFSFLLMAFFILTGVVFQNCSKHKTQFEDSSTAASVVKTEIGCSVRSVQNGTVGSAPRCSIVCDTGFTQLNGSCVAIQNQTTCAVSSVPNGTIGAFPACTINCNNGFTQSAGSCVTSPQTCVAPIVANGSVGAAPACVVTCNQGYTYTRSGTCSPNVAQVCEKPIVPNGSVSAAPGCTVTCNTGFTLSGGNCVASTTSCLPASVLNGSVGALPLCIINCNSGYQRDGNQCVKSAAPVVAEFSCSTTGPITSYSISANVRVASADIGKAGTYFVIGFYNNEYYSYDGTKWTLYTASTPNPTGAFTNNLAEISNYPLYTNANFYGLSGAQVYVGYGVGSDISSSLTEMLNTKKFNTCGPALPAAVAASFSCPSNYGSKTSYKIIGNISVASSDMGKAGAYFVIGLFNGEYYSFDGSVWTKYTGSNATGFSISSLANITNYELFSNLNYTGFEGTQLYIGYGVGSNISTALDDLLARSTFGTCGAALP